MQRQHHMEHTRGCEFTPVSSDHVFGQGRGSAPDYETVRESSILQLRYSARRMPDPNETRALKASLRGALDTAAQLASFAARVDALDEQQEIDNELIAELARVTAAHAVASAAVRGLVVTMQSRRDGDASA